VIKLSIISTVYNDSQLVRPLVEAIDFHTKPLNIDYEIILVNDFSSDDSQRSIQEICQSHTHVKGIELRRNHGQQIAMSVGIEHATGERVLIMDGDLQNPPEAIPELYNKSLEGYDIVYAVSNTRNNGLDEFTSRLCWFVLNKVLSGNYVENQLMMKIMHHEVADEFKDYREHFRLVCGITHDLSSNIATLEVENKKRTIGSSHYTFFKRMDLMVDFIISTSARPLNFMLYLGVFTALVSLILSFTYLISHLIQDTRPGFTSLILVNLVIGGIIISMLGLIGRYLSNMYLETKSRPLYHIKNKVNFNLKK